MEAPGSAAPAVSRSRARRPRGVPGPAPSATPRLGVRQIPRLVIVQAVVLLLLLLSLTNLVTAATLPDQPAATQGQSPPQITCLPGQYLFRYGTCKPCIDGKSYTNQRNMKACIPCSICPEDTYQNVSCTTTRDTVCICKAGTFREQDSPEFCRICTECTDKEIEASPCTPGSDRKCVSPESNANVTEDSLAPENSDIIYPIILVVVLVAVAGLCFIAYKLYKMKRTLCLRILGQASLLRKRNLNDDDPQVINSQTQDTGDGLAQRLL
uniref:tumor necrosis factor receptor superfamily member 10B-like n=1 Tax=Jaculus jaculus TaxID=51337 RepID=UPI001E1B5764|nr:tumor necrosis factor receptor superfamily member 10B-like [Jaculus jaculus]